jgi:hypothetical protein
VSVDVERLSFFDQPAFHGCAPVLAPRSMSRHRLPLGARRPLRLARPKEVFV